MYVLCAGYNMIQYFNCQQHIYARFFGDLPFKNWHFPILFPVSHARRASLPVGRLTRDLPREMCF